MRLYGKPINEEALEFGEQLWWRPPRTTSYNVLMEPRWQPGVWLGRQFGLDYAHHIIALEDEHIHHARAVQRIPANERWSIEVVQAANSCSRGPPEAGGSWRSGGAPYHSPNSPN